MALKIALVSLICLVVNIPLGMWRERTRKFSWQWFVAIHASIPFIIWLRFRLALEPWWVAVPLNITAAVVGQLIGGTLRKRRS